MATSKIDSNVLISAPEYSGADTALSSGPAGLCFCRAAAGGAGNPTTLGIWTILQLINAEKTYGFQLAFHTNNTDIYIRNIDNGTKRSWRLVGPKYADVSVTSDDYAQVVIPSEYRTNGRQIIYANSLNNAYYIVQQSGIYFRTYTASNSPAYAKNITFNIRVWYV